MKKIIVAIIGVTALVVILVLLIGSRPADQPSQEVAKAPDFSLVDYHGNTVHLADFVGKSLIINSWAAWCPFCRKELVDFATAQKEFGDKIVIVAIDRAETLAIAKKYTDELGVTNNLVFLLDPGDSFYRSIGGFSMPETIFVNKKGEIVIHKRGPMDLQEILDKIRKLISR